jgi:hypothetical protein
MLRISYAPFVSGGHWSLCGQLAGPWVQELRSCWEHRRGESAGSLYVFDLTDVTFIDEQGERLLEELRNAGAEFVAPGVATKYLIENLKAMEKPLHGKEKPQ